MNQQATDKPYRIEATETAFRLYYSDECISYALNDIWLDALDSVIPFAHCHDYKKWSDEDESHEQHIICVPGVWTIGKGRIFDADELQRMTEVVDYEYEQHRLWLEGVPDGS